MIQLTVPYIPGFLAFREADPIVDLYNELMASAPQYEPDVSITLLTHFLPSKLCTTYSYAQVKFEKNELCHTQKL
jgi:hypothetical protein